MIWDRIDLKIKIYSISKGWAGCGRKLDARFSASSSSAFSSKTCPGSREDNTQKQRHGDFFRFKRIATRAKFAKLRTA
jgi:hypothetical protein